MNNKTKNKGFTLVEVLVGILAAIVIPQIKENLASASEIIPDGRNLPDDFSKLVNIVPLGHQDYRLVTYFDKSGEIMTASYDSQGHIYKKECWNKPLPLNK